MCASRRRGVLFGEPVCSWPNVNVCQEGASVRETLDRDGWTRRAVAVRAGARKLERKKSKFVIHSKL